MGGPDTPSPTKKKKNGPRIFSKIVKKKKWGGGGKGLAKVAKACNCEILLS